MGRFVRRSFIWQETPYFYRLYLPRSSPLAAPALVVMLHGCKQDAADFARGTDMNRLAAERGLAVLYPEQNVQAHRLRCWNWYSRAHQGQAGEAGMIAALTRQVAQSVGADLGRIYIAGLSAGGAMASVVAALSPDLYCALGVHSGIPAGAASNVISALDVMRRGARGPLARWPSSRRDAPMPTIVFNGTADRTVHPDNSEQLTQLTLTALQATGLSLNHLETPLGGTSTRPTKRVGWRAADGKNYLEHWAVEDGLHAWSGGQAAGSYTDPEGPDASVAMLEFFLQHRRADPPALAPSGFEQVSAAQQTAQAH